MKRRYATDPPRRRCGAGRCHNLTYRASGIDPSGHHRKQPTIPVSTRVTTNTKPVNETFPIGNPSLLTMCLLFLLLLMRTKKKRMAGKISHRNKLSTHSNSIFAASRCKCLLGSCTSFVFASIPSRLSLTSDKEASDFFLFRSTPTVRLCAFSPFVLLSHAVTLPHLLGHKPRHVVAHLLLESLNLG